MSKFRDLTGCRFNRLVVLMREPNANRRVMWLCRCDCGNHISVRSDSLSDINTQSCGCLHRQAATKIGDRTSTHRMSGTPEHRAWKGMINRCENPRSRNYDRWGGRGIKICPQWRNSFARFFRDMGAKPSPLLSLDRIDNNGNYEPGNCRWATAKQQANNQRKRKCLTRS